MKKEKCIKNIDLKSMKFEFCNCCECSVDWAAAIFYTYGDPLPNILNIEKKVKARGYSLSDKAQKLLDSVKNKTAPREGGGL